MFHERDRQTIESITRKKLGELPGTFEKEYNKWITAKRRAIGNGDLGPVLCVALCGHAGVLVGSDAVQAKPPIDWSVIEQGTAVQVADVEGKIIFGAYRGKIGPGRLAIELVGDEYVREYAQVKVLLRGDAIEEPTVVEEEPVSEVKDVEIKGIDWSLTPTGTPVLVDSEEGDVMLGKFSSVGEDGNIFVAVSGELEPSSYAPELIALGE
jgi:hypothetical protein